VGDQFSKMGKMNSMKHFTGDQMQSIGNAVANSQPV